MSGYIFADQDSVEPIADSLGEIWGNAAIYNVLNPIGGDCALTYSASDMTVDLAAGTVTHYGATVAVATAAGAFTLESDPTYPRWTWLAISSAGSAAVVSGDPAAAPSVPDFGDRVPLALVYVQAGLTIANSATYHLDKRVAAPAQAVVYKYKSTTQALTNTTYADVTAASGTFKFRAEASGVYIADYLIIFSNGATGGLKLQITGPSAPTSVSITGTREVYAADANTSVYAALLPAPFTTVTAFSSDVAAANSNAAGTANVYPTAAVAAIRVRLRLINGANAGDVTLQAAENSASDTSTLQVGCTMIAQRIA